MDGNSAPKKVGPASVASILDPTFAGMKPQPRQSKPTRSERVQRLQQFGAVFGHVDQGQILRPQSRALG